MKIVYCLRRRPDLSPEAFRRHWLEVHGPLVRTHQRVLRILRYVQVHTEAGALTEKLRGFADRPSLTTASPRFGTKAGRLWRRSGAIPPPAPPAGSCWKTSDASLISRAPRSGPARSMS